jgi:hypothetical protein
MNAKSLSDVTTVIEHELANRPSDWLDNLKLRQIDERLEVIDRLSELYNPLGTHGFDDTPSNSLKPTPERLHNRMLEDVDFSAKLELIDWDIATALYGLLAHRFPWHRAHRFLEIARRFQCPSTFWRSLHMCLRLIPKAPERSFSTALGRLRPFWREDFLIGEQGIDYRQLPECMSVYRSRYRDRRPSLIWTRDFSIARAHAMETGSIIIEARITKSDIAGLQFDFQNSNLLLFSAPATSALSRIEP